MLHCNGKQLDWGDEHPQHVMAVPNGAWQSPVVKPSATGLVRQGAWVKQEISFVLILIAQHTGKGRFLGKLPAARDCLTDSVYTGTNATLVAVHTWALAVASAPAPAPALALALAEACQR